MPVTTSTVAVNIASAGDNKIIAGVSGFQIKIKALILIVGGEVNITLKDYTTALTGAMDFGGTSEPRGMVCNFGECAIEISVGKSFIINLSAAVQVSGLVSYYME